MGPTVQNPHTPNAALDAAAADLGALSMGRSITSPIHLMTQNRELQGLFIDPGNHLFTDRSQEYGGGPRRLAVLSSREDLRLAHFSDPRARDLFLDRARSVDLDPASLREFAAEMSAALSLRVSTSAWRTYAHPGAGLQKVTLPGVEITDRVMLEYFDGGRNSVGQIEIPIFARIENGRVSAEANSIAENRQSAEVHVNTPVEFRGRGHGAEVVAAWLSHVVEQGKLAFYAHSFTNAASARVAEKLGFQRVYDDIRFLIGEGQSR